MRTTEFVCESSELTVLRRLYDRGSRVPALRIAPARSHLDSTQVVERHSRVSGPNRGRGEDAERGVQRWRPTLGEASARA